MDLGSHVFCFSRVSFRLISSCPLGLFWVLIESILPVFAICFFLVLPVGCAPFCSNIVVFFGCAFEQSRMAEDGRVSIA